MNAKLSRGDSMLKLSELFENCAYKIKYEQAGDSVNYAFRSYNDTLYIYFEGSNSISDWVRNFLFPAKPYKDMKIPYRVHRGFLAAWKEVEDIIINKICEDDENGNYRWKSIIIVGYSHGGALAAFCHECVWFWRPDIRDNIWGFGFEAPRIYAGWHIKKELKKRWEHFTVIRTNSDIVTHCPPVLFGFRHVGSMLKIKGDTKLLHNKLPKCIKSHFPEVVLQALRDSENEN